jgi:adenylate cyclase
MFTIYSFVEFFNLDLNLEKNAMFQYWVSPSQYLESNLFAIFFGLWFIVFNRLSEEWHIERLSFGKIILVKSGIYLVGLSLIFVLIFLILDTLGLYPENLFLYTFGSNMKILVGLVFFTITLLILLLNFILQSIKNMGHYNLKSFLTGKYHKPIVEDRTFLFIDLKSSTSHAEKLGHLVYSKMIKECIHDINTLLNRYKSVVYQYVGDEIVLTWKTDEAVESLNFIEIFYAFEKRLQSRASHYMKKYNIVPEFKAGANSGRVTATEIGVVKRDLAFHGDVLNTSARILELCNKYQKKLLISGNLKNQIGDIYSIPYEFKPLGNQKLKGKDDNVEVFAAVKKNMEFISPEDEMKVG